MTMSLQYSSALISKLPNLSQTRREDTWAPHFTDLIESDSIDKSRFRASQFQNPGEGQIYSRVISRVIDGRSRVGQIRLIDLGCGSSLPTIATLLKHQDLDIEVVAVDIDPAAVAVSEHNVMIAGLSSRFTFVNTDLIDYINSFVFRAGDIIVANPPYIPVHFSVVDPDFLPINGGVDGLRFITPIINISRKCRIPIVFLASSLSSPFTLLDNLQAFHKVDCIEGTFVPFGKYLKRSEIHVYLSMLRSHDQIEFYETEAGNYEFLTLGFYAEPKQKLLK